MDIAERIKGLCLMADLFMTEHLKDARCVELVLRIILDRPGLVVGRAQAGASCAAAGTSASCASWTCARRRSSRAGAGPSG